MSIYNDPIFQYLAQYAYEPMMVYTGIVVMMLASSVGFPVPEEVTLISVGLLAFMGSHPDKFPPPYYGAPVINVYEAAIVCFFAVLAADTIIFMIGRKYGRLILKSPKFKRLIKDEAMQKIENWTSKYGILAAAIFRFTPGVRFPGHIACGMLNFPLWKFLLVDCAVALISVPTQVIIVAKYGDSILGTIKEFKIVLFSILGIALVAYLIYRFFRRNTATST